MNNQPSVFSGMRPTGKLHIGHYFGVLVNWAELQKKHQCWYSIVDWHALTTHYADPEKLQDFCREVCIDWLAAGIDPKKSTIFLQSHVPQHAELHLALSMLTPLGWLERVPSYKEQITKLRNLDLTTYGFLGYPLLQSADILLYKASLVPVGEDQVAHIEMAREVARRFNNLYGKGAEFNQSVEKLNLALNNAQKELLEQAIRAYNQDGNTAPAEEMLKNFTDSGIDNSLVKTAKLLVHQKGHAILTEPNAIILKETAKVPGLDGQKMSKSYNNTITLRDDPDRIATSIKTMPTDPARVRLQDPGTPEKCPVWQLHLIYSSEQSRKEIHAACSNADIGCVQCKKRVLEPMVEQNNTFAENAKQYNDKSQIDKLLHLGAEKARDTASATMKEVHKAMRMLPAVE